MLAAYIDGEGCIELRRTAKDKPYYCLTITVSNTNPLLALWLRDRFEGTIRKKDIRGNNHRRPAFNWCCYTRLAETILRNCLQFFVIKKNEAEIALGYRATVHKESGGDREKQGAIVTPDMISTREELRRRLSEAKRSYDIESLPKEFFGNSIQ